MDERLVMNNTSPLFTISIPTYNRAEGYLRDTLASAVAQNYQNLEIMISDNASSDNTEAVVRSFDDPRIRYVKHEKNIGHAGNFDFCITGARGHYVLVLHDDDVIDADFIQTCADAVGDRLDYGMIRTGVRVIDDVGAILEEHPNCSVSSSSVDDFALEWFSGELALYMCNTVFNREKVIEVGGFRSKKDLWHDVVVEMKIAAISPRLEIEAVKSNFRRHGESRGSSLVKAWDWVEDSIYLLDVIKALSGKRREEVVKQGQLYFCKRNYRRIEKMIGSPILRLRLYFKVSKLFNHCYSPVRLLVTQPLRNKLGRVKRKLISQ